MTGNWEKQTGGLTRWLVPLFLFSLVLAVLLPASPLWQEFPSWDSGVFLYTGWQLQQGALPYRDVWDHKPPLIFAINALGLTIGGGSRWGVCGLEVVSLLAAAWIGFDLMRRAFGTLAAVYVSIAWMLNAFLTMDGGNYTTEFALPLQFGCLWLMATAEEKFSTRRAFVVGILSGLLFWLKQNDVGIPLAIALYFALGMLLAKGKRVYLSLLAAMAAGALGVTLVVILPFAIQGALRQFWDAAFLYNFVYSQRMWTARLNALLFVPTALPAMGLTLLAILGWLVGVVTFANAARQHGDVMRQSGETLDRIVGCRQGRSHDTPSHPPLVRLLCVLLLAMPIELALVTVSSSRYDHYYLAPLPVFALLGAFAFRLVVTILERRGVRRTVIVGLVGVLVFVLVSLAARNEMAMLRRLGGRIQNFTGIIEYISRQTTANEFIFIWGGETRVAFQTRRTMPTRFIYSAPLRRPGYTGADEALELLSDLEQRPPQLIFDTHPENIAFFEFMITTPEIEARSKALLALYEKGDTIDGWTVYERRIP